MQNTNEFNLNPPERTPPPEELRRPRPNLVELERLLETWMLGDQTEQRETFDVIRRSLDGDRPDGYKLFW